ncbi:MULTISPECIES: hypothetical protein [unclassified Streptomyces]|uniref:hypothetical protein n=1 Tax=unclassified Streptomyces TaxID=2593676 RepID=UPI003FA3B221
MMIPSTAKALDRPKKKYFWAELTASATESDKVRLGAADPAVSATSLLALTSIAASSDKQGGDGDTRVTATAEPLAQRMSDGDTQVLEAPAQDDSAAEGGNPQRNQAVLFTEQAAFARNAGPAGGGSLDLFHPKDGTPLLNHPWTLVDETKLSTDETRAALRFMAGRDDSRTERPRRPGTAGARPGTAPNNAPQAHRAQRRATPV